MSERDAIVCQRCGYLPYRHSGGIPNTCPIVATYLPPSGDHLPASVADRYRDSDIAAHVGEVERLREATDILQRLHDYDSWGGKGFHASKAFNAKEDGKAFLARQTLEASR
ncbi:MAG: hypothetical protein A3H25_18250 [Sphingomonadales bacterium RIFCSPLOWO2_12_FULL_63_15]|nr:MAG: hypothetical protein A3H25_18250 [Sphingomonadales bacterium RIFCSPLOWO2_12_FULL_63_15]